jgi:hypothetical protein
MYTVGPGIWRGDRKMCKMRHKHCMTWNMARNTEKREKREMPTLGPGLWQYNSPRRKMRNSHCRTWNMERKPKNEENEKLTW